MYTLCTSFRIMLLYCGVTYLISVCENHEPIHVIRLKQKIKIKINNPLRQSNALGRQRCFSYNN